MQENITTITLTLVFICFHLVHFCLVSGDFSDKLSRCQGQRYFGFLVACTRLYNPLCQSVHPSVGNTLLFRRLRAFLTLCPEIVSLHCVPTICPYIVSQHFVLVLFPDIVSRHCVPTLCPNIVT